MKLKGAFKSFRFWPDIDLELRRAALERRVEVRLLASHWNHTREDMVRWLRSLQDLSGSSYPPVNIEVVRISSSSLYNSWLTASRRFVTE